MLKHISMRLNTLLLKLLANSVIANILYMLYRHLKVALGSDQKIVTADGMVNSGRKSKLAVIGCGPSINKLDDDFFDTLHDYDITAFSYAALLPLDITYYLYEIPRGTLQQHHEEFLYPGLKQKEKERNCGISFLKTPTPRKGCFMIYFRRSNLR